MAGRKIGEIYGEIKLKNQQFNTGLTQSQSKMKAFGSAAKIAFAAMAAAAVAATAAVIKMTKDTVRYALEVRKAALATGVAVEQFQELAYAAKQEHADLGALEKGLGNLTIRLSYAGDGLETYLRYFRALGLEYRNQDGTLRDTIDVFYDIADKAHKGALSTEELAAITQLFGARAGRVLIPMLKLGSEELKKLGIEARNAGEIMLKEDVEAIKEFDNKMTVLKTTMQGLVRQFVIGLIPALDTFAGSTEEAALQTENLRIQVKEMGYRVGLVFGVLADAVRVLGIFMSKTWAIMAEGLSKLLKGMAWLPGIGDELQHTGELMHQMAIEFYNQAAALEEQESWLQRINDWYKEATDTVKTFGEETKKAIQGNINRMGEFQNIGARTFVDLSKYAGMGRENLLKVKKTTENISIAASTMGATLGEAFGMLINKGKSFNDVLKVIIKQLIQMAAMTMAGPWGFAAGLIGGLLPFQKGGYIPAALTSPNLPEISAGYANKPSLLVGEGRGEGEMVVPDSRWKDMITVNIGNMIPLEKAFVDVFINLPQGQKQQIYRRGIKPAMDIEEIR